MNALLNRRYFFLGTVLVYHFAHKLKHTIRGLVIGYSPKVRQESLLVRGKTVELYRKMITLTPDVVQPSEIG